MSTYWSVHLPHVLDERGALGPSTDPGLRIAKYWTQIVAQATNYKEPTTIRCRRRPGGRPCGEVLTLFFDVATFDVLWFCPVCDDNGRISGWEGTFWDNSELTENTAS